MLNLGNVAYDASGRAARMTSILSIERRIRALSVESRSSIPSDTSVKRLRSARDADLANARRRSATRPKERSARRVSGGARDDVTADVLSGSADAQPQRPALVGDYGSPMRNFSVRSTTVSLRTNGGDGFASTRRHPKPSP